MGGAQRLGWPDPVFWTAYKDSVTTVLFVLSIVIAGGAAYRVVVLDNRVERYRGALRDSRQQLEQERRLRSLQDLFRVFLIGVAEGAGVPDTSLGVSAWRVSSDGQRLERLDHLRFHGRARSGITWTRGKGTIGQCWAQSRELLTNLVAFRQLSEADFGVLPDETRLGMSWDEYRATMGYSAVFATPVRDASGTFVGCVSLDCDADDAAAALDKALHEKVLMGVIEIMRNTVAAVLVVPPEE